MGIIEDTDVHLFDRSKNVKATECGFSLGGTRVRSVSGYPLMVTCKDCLREAERKDAAMLNEREDEKNRLRTLVQQEVRGLLREELERITREDNLRAYRREMELTIPTKPVQPDAMARARIDHALLETTVISYNTAIYKCSCGQEGTAVMADHLSNYIALRQRAKKNHELHQARAYVKLLEE